jgi:hypothetical protein
MTSRYCGYVRDQDVRSTTPHAKVSSQRWSVVRNKLGGKYWDPVESHRTLVLFSLELMGRRSAFEIGVGAC